MLDSIQTIVVALVVAVITFISSNARSSRGNDAAITVKLKNIIAEVKELKTRVGALNGRSSSATTSLTWGGALVN